MDAFVADLLAMKLRDREAGIVDVRDTDDGDARVVQLCLHSDVQDLSRDQYRIGIISVNTQFKKKYEFPV